MNLQAMAVFGIFQLNTNHGILNSLIIRMLIQDFKMRDTESANYSRVSLLTKVLCSL